MQDTTFLAEKWMLDDDSVSDTAALACSNSSQDDELDAGPCDGWLIVPADVDVPGAAAEESGGRSDLGACNFMGQCGRAVVIGVLACTGAARTPTSHDATAKNIGGACGNLAGRAVRLTALAATACVATSAEDLAGARTFANSSRVPDGEDHVEGGYRVCGI